MNRYEKKIRRIIGESGLAVAKRYTPLLSPYFNKRKGMSMYSECGNYRFSDHWATQEVRFVANFKEMILAKKKDDVWYEICRFTKLPQRKPLPVAQSGRIIRMLAEKEKTKIAEHNRALILQLHNNIGLLPNKGRGRVGNIYGQHLKGIVNTYQKYTIDEFMI